MIGSTTRRVLPARRQRLILSLLVSAALPLAGYSHAAASAEHARVTLNLKDADISTLIATVSEVTGKNFVIDPRVKGKVTVISSSPMDESAIYATFLSVLEVSGFAAIPSGSSIKIVPEANARTEGGSYLSHPVGIAGDDIVTKVFDIHNGSASQLVAILRPLVAQSGHLAAYASSNSLIVSDRASNIDRLEHLIGEIDRGGDRDIEIIHLDNAVADDVVRMLSTMAQQAKQSDPGATQPTILADVRTNSILVSGEQSERAKLVALIRRLDEPGSNKGDTQVVFLNYADAEDLAPLLMGNAQPAKSGGSKNDSMFSSSSSSSSLFGSSNRGTSSASPSAPSAAPSSASAAAGSSSNPDLKVLADRDTNALVITAPPKLMQQVRSIIAQLDIRRSQVLVEAIVAEVSADKSSQLGIDWLAYNPNAIGAAGILNSSTSSALASASSALSSSTSSSTLSTSALESIAASAIGTGGTALIGTTTSSGAIYGALIKALASDANTNILSTPTLVTLDNQEAKIEVGQTVPELTGSYANSGVTSTTGTVNPFQTLDRQDVGLKLGITPTIGEGDTVRLKIEFENSNIASGTAGTASLITNKRTVSNTVSIEGGQILVIGGLIDDQTTDSLTRIPLLSDIPWVGNLFKSRTVDRQKRNLMIFVHPVILRQRKDGDFFTARKYQDTRKAEINAANGPVPLVGGRPPVLYQYNDYVRDSNLPAVGAPNSAETPGDSSDPEAPPLKPEKSRGPKTTGVDTPDD